MEGLLAAIAGDSDGLGIASLASSAGYPVGALVTIVVTKGALVASCKIGMLSETETGAGAGTGACVDGAGSTWTGAIVVTKGALVASCKIGMLSEIITGAGAGAGVDGAGSTCTGAGEDTSSESGTGIVDGTSTGLSLSVGHRVFVMSEFSLCSDPSSIPLGGVVGASRVGTDTSSLPSAPSVPSGVSVSELLPSTLLLLLLMSTLIVLSFAAAAAAASALSLALLFAISIILSTSPLNVKVSSLALRGFLKAWRGAS